MIIRRLNYFLFFLVLFVNFSSQMRFGISSTFYIMKFALFVIHLLFMSLSLLNEKITLPRQIKILTPIFFIWFSIMVIDTVYVKSFNSLISALLVISSYILLFFYCFVIFPNYMLWKKISYHSIVKVAYFAVFIALMMSALLGYGNSTSFHFDPFSLRNRYMGYFEHPNILGLYSFMGICLSFLLSQISKNKLYLVLVPVYLTFVHLSSSRTSFYVTVLLILAIMLHKIVMNFLKLFLNPLFLTFISGSILLLILLIDFPTLMEVIDKGTSYRLTIWSELLSQSDSLFKIIFGQGTAKTDASKDNYYVLVLINSGIAGLLAFLSIVILIFRYTIKQVKNKSSEYIVIIFVLFSLYSLTESVFYTLGNGFSMFIWISVVLCIFNQIDEQKRKVRNANLTIYNL